MQPQVLKFDSTLPFIPSPPASNVSQDEILSQLRRMRECILFAKSPRLTSFLTFTVEQTLAGNQHLLKEYLIGVEVFGRPETFDPRLDSIVRVEARRLRHKVDRYYATFGHQDPVLVSYQRGDYVPQFFARNAKVDGHRSYADVLVATADYGEATRLCQELLLYGYQANTAPKSEVPSIPEEDGQCRFLLLDLSLVDHYAEWLGHPHIHVIALAPSLSTSHVAMAERASADACLVRPLRPGELTATLRLSEARHQRADRLQQH